MKNLGRIRDGKDVATKDYADALNRQLDEKKLEEEDLTETSNTEIQELWNRIILEKQ